ncbi:unnamed protein product, partial [Porites lobata]
MSQVVKNNRGFLQFLAVCPAHQRQFLLRTASPQQLHALVQILYNILKEYILIPEENKRNVLPYKDALVNLAETNVPYKTKKRILVQEGDGFIQDLLVPACRKSVLLICCIVWPLCVNNEVTKPRALNTFLDGLAELGIDKGLIKNKKLLSDLIEKEKGYRNVENTSDNESNNDESSSDIENQEEEEVVASENGVETEGTQESDNDTENDSEETES